MAGEARDRQPGIPSQVSAVGDESFQQIDINTNSSCWIVVRTIKSFYFITFWRKKKKKMTTKWTSRRALAQQTLGATVGTTISIVGLHNSFDISLDIFSLQTLTHK